MNATPQPVHFGFFDIGSNAVRVTVFEVCGHRTDVRAKQKEICQLGRNDNPDYLYPTGVQTAFDTLTRYCQLVRAPQWNMRGIVAVATDAIRRAKDGPQFIQRLKSELDLTVRILSEEEEGYYGARGVLRGMPQMDGIVADLGGGSLQLTRVYHGTIPDHQSISLPLGILRLANLQENPQSYIDRQLNTIPETLMNTDELCVIGGSLRTLAKLYLKRSGEKNIDVHGFQMDPYMICRMSEWMNGPEQKIAIEDMIRTYGLEEQRASTLPHAARVLSTLITRFDLDKITVSSAGIRDGILQDVISGAIIPDPLPRLINAGPTHSPAP